MAQKPFRSTCAEEGTNQWFDEVDAAIAWLKGRPSGRSLKKRDYDPATDQVTWIRAGLVSEREEITWTNKYLFKDKRTGEIIATHAGRSEQEARTKFREMGDVQLFFGDLESDLEIVDEGRVVN